MPCLIFQDRPAKDMIPVADDGEFLLGRTEENDLTIPDDPLVSRKHCAIYLNHDEEIFILRDLGSSNGTVINEEILSGKEAFLSDGDMIKIGDTKLIFRMDSSESYRKTITPTMKCGKTGKRETLGPKDSASPEKEQASVAPPVPPTQKVKSSSSLSPGMEIDGYRIIRTLSAGARSTVYLAFQETVKRTVALKIYSARADDESKLLFKVLLQSVGRISHANVVNCFDCGIFDDFCYLVMPYAAEGNLDDLISRQPHFRERAAVEITLKIAGALDRAMTEHCILHLDMNPGNVLLSDSGEPVVSGLGMDSWKVRNFQSGSTYFNGNTRYTSPEQRLDLHADWRSDLYSLGIIFCEMLAGRKSSTSADEKGVIRKDVPEKLVFPPNLSKDLVSIIRKMTAKDPEHRFSSWSEFIKALDSVLNPKRQLTPIRQRQVLRQPRKISPPTLARA